MSHSSRLIGVMLVAIAAIVASFGLTSTASASTYEIAQCTNAQPGADYTLDNPGVAGYQFANSCGQAAGDGYLEIMRAGNAPAAGAYKQIAFVAPNGTRFNRVTGRNVRSSTAGSGLTSYVFARRTAGGGEQMAVQLNTGSVSENFDTSAWGGPQAPLDRIGAGVTCTRSSGLCDAQFAAAHLLNMRFYIEDTVAPATPQTSGSILGGWVNGSKSVTINGSDTGAGVAATSTWVNGSLVDIGLPCSPDQTRLRPCALTGSDSTTMNVTTAPFTQGNNALQTCVGEYGSNPQSTCKTETVQVDTIAPTAPTSLSVGGGDGWKRDNDFDLSWSNPSQGAQTAPIVGATVRLTKAGGGSPVSDYYPATGITSLSDIEVPSVGDWTAEVYLRDAAGNETLANAGNTHLRYDDTVPVESVPEEANGWLNRAGVSSGYQQEWAQPEPDQVPPSGISGYRVAINMNSDTDPCSGAQDARACGGPVTEAGLSNTSRVLGDAALEDGTNYVHVAPVSGSGMRATDIGHTPLKVDTIDPSTSLQGDGNGAWINHDANLQAVAVDDLSGMVDTDEYPLDAPPSTFLVVDGAESSDADSNVSATVSTEGVHTVSYRARDLAGNTEQAHAGTVRIDKTDPAVAFTNSQDPEDPDELRAPVSDQLSGVVDGKISYRADGGNEWKSLDTSIKGEQLIARVDSGDMRPGVTYEFRAAATDLAGNTRTTMNKANGEPMKVVGPFRPTTGVVDLKVNGKAKAKVKYGKKAKVSGSLLTDVGSRPVASVPVEITESFLLGSKKRTRTSVVTTDANGGFATKLKKGPSRKVTAVYKGDRRYLGTSSAAAKLSVRSKVTLKAPSTVDSDRGITFSGAVKSKGAKLAKKGKRLEVQVRTSSGWKAVKHSIRTNKKGKFSLAYKFTATYTDPVKYQFRAVVLKERGFPYLPSKSKKRSVTVTP